MRANYAKLLIIILALWNISENIIAIDSSIRLKDQDFYSARTNFFLEKSFSDQSNNELNWTSFLATKMLFFRLQLEDVYLISLLEVEGEITTKRLATAILPTSFPYLVKNNTDPSNLQLSHQRNFSFNRWPQTKIIIRHWLEGGKLGGQITGISFKEVINIAREFIEYMKRENYFQSTTYLAYHTSIFNFMNVDIMFLTPLGMNSLGEYFFTNSKITKYELSSIELDLIELGHLTVLEVYELRALRAVSSLFEELSFLRDDVGGWGGNFYGHLMPAHLTGKQTICHEEAFTHYSFLKVIEGNSLLKHFKVFGTVVRSLHEAVLLQNKRTNLFYVYDSWFLAGGEPANIVSLDDWNNRNDSNNVVTFIQ